MRRRKCWDTFALLILITLSRKQKEKKYRS